jgi:hypothetical protein
VLLVAMYDVGAENFRENRRGERIVALAAHVPRAPHHPDVQLIDPLLPGFSAEGKQARRRAGRHVPRKLQCVPLGAAHDARRPEEGRHQMQHSRTSRSRQASSASMAACQF